MPLLSRSLWSSCLGIALLAPCYAQIGPDLTLGALSPSAEAPASVGAAGDDPADIGHYLLAAGATQAQLSPDGTLLAFSYNISGEPQLWLMDSAGAQAAQQLTFGNGIRFFEWAPDSHWLLYGADNSGNEQEAYYRISAEGGKETLVLPAVSGGFRQFGDFNADGSAFYFASTERNGLDFDIYRHTLASGNTELVYEGSYGFFISTVSPDERYLVLHETEGEDADKLHLLELQTGTLRTLSAPEPRANHANGGSAWLADGSGFFLATNVGREYATLAFYNLAISQFQFFDYAERDIGNVLLCGDNQRYLVWSVNEDGFFDLYSQDRLTKQITHAEFLPYGVVSATCSSSGTQLAARISNWETPGDLWLWDLQRNSAERVFEAELAGLDPERMIEPLSVRMPARDGVELQGLLYLPDASSRASATAAPPVVFDIHGGPTAQALAGFNAVVQYHLDRGVAVFQPNVRGSSGFGRSYSTLDDQDKRLDSVRDLIDMLDFFAADGRVDVNRAAAMGGSYGGYMVNAVLAAWPGRFKAGVALYGVADWVTALEVASPALKASDRIEYGDISEAGWREFYTEISPLRQAEKISVPVLYSHGVMDPRIDIAETETMVKALRARGIEAPYVRFADEGHGWRKLSNRLFYYRQQAEFLERVLGVE